MANSSPHMLKFIVPSSILMFGQKEDETLAYLIGQPSPSSHSLDLLNDNCRNF